MPSKFKREASFILVGLFLLAFFYIAYHSQVSTQPKSEIEYVRLSGEKVKVDLAITPEEKSKGLGGRLGLNEDEGLLFIFERPGMHNFWMENMNFPIDIIWMDESQKIIYIEKNLSPATFPTSFGPHKESKYVLEVVAGFTEEYRVKVGDKVEFE